MNKKSTSYLSKVYSKTNKPYTTYPSKLARLLLDRYMPQGKCDLLDVGCGRGELSLQFSRKHRVHAIDNSDFKHPQDYKYTHVNLIDGINLPENAFDIVFSKSVIEHFHNPLDLLNEMRRVIKPGGRIVCMTPDWESQYRNFYNDCTHVSPFSQKSLRDALSICEFKNIEVQKLYQLPFTWNGSILKIIPKCINALVPYTLYAKTKLTRFSKEKMLIAVATKPL